MTAAAILAAEVAPLTLAGAATAIAAAAVPLVVVIVRTRHPEAEQPATATKLLADAAVALVHPYVAEVHTLRLELADVEARNALALAEQDRRHSDAIATLEARHVADVAALTAAVERCEEERAHLLATHPNPPTTEDPPHAHA